jgi:sterol desaturase/sphingolipid hydroxylase (fatty acid hydroxylase superfamily)
MDLGLLIWVTSTFAALLLAERIRPARAMPRVPRWWSRGLGAFCAVALIGSQLAPAVARALAPASANTWSLPTQLGAGFAAFFAVSLAHYALHRWQHNSARLWRWSHHLHHAPARVDLLGAFMLHPLDALLRAAPLVLVIAVCGLSPTAAAVASYLTFVAQAVPHLDLRTPVWLGRIVQRPEAHSLHHGRDLHAYNYGDVTLWDQLFGTFRNPPEFHPELGFSHLRGDHHAQP